MPVLQRPQDRLPRQSPKLLRSCQTTKSQARIPPILGEPIERCKSAAAFGQVWGHFNKRCLGIQRQFAPTNDSHEGSQT